MDWHPQAESNVIRTHQIHAVSHHVMHHVDTHSMHLRRCIGIHRVVVSITPTTLQRLVEASGVKTVVSQAGSTHWTKRARRSQPLPFTQLSTRNESTMATMACDHHVALYTPHLSQRPAGDAANHDSSAESFRGLSPLHTVVEAVCV